MGAYLSKCKLSSEQISFLDKVLCHVKAYSTQEILCSYVFSFGVLWRKLKFYVCSEFDDFLFVNANRQSQLLPEFIDTLKKAFRVHIRIFPLQLLPESTRKRVDCTISQLTAANKRLDI